MCLHVCDVQLTCVAVRTALPVTPSPAAVVVHLVTMATCASTSTTAPTTKITMMMAPLPVL